MVLHVWSAKRNCSGPCSLINNREWVEKVGLVNMNASRLNMLPNSSSFSLHTHGQQLSCCPSKSPHMFSNYKKKILTIRNSSFPNWGQDGWQADEGMWWPAEFAWTKTCFRKSLTRSYNKVGWWMGKWYKNPSQSCSVKTNPTFETIDNLDFEVAERRTQSSSSGFFIKLWHTFVLHNFLLPRSHQYKFNLEKTVRIIFS